MASMFPNVSSPRVLTEPSTSRDSMMTRVSERLTSGPPRLVVTGINPDESSKLTWIPLGFFSNRVSSVQEKQVQDSQTTQLSSKPEAPMTKTSHGPSQGRKDSEKAKNRARCVLVLVVLFAALHLLPHGIFVVYVIFQADPITPFLKAQSSLWLSLIYRSFFLSCVFNPYVYFLSDSRVTHQGERGRLLKSKPAVLEAAIPSSCEPPSSQHIDIQCSRLSNV
ncbi:uncharacterized protein [Littorina saxatilis]|uniref:uncharacterized protein n=1 Tax=Littorina saxatilis TaxID=31220 RepID=UPI0038B46C5E